MNKSTKTILWVGIYGVVAYGIYYMIKNMHVTRREKNILIISQDNYKGFDDAYLKSWANAIKSNLSEFTYQGKVYLSNSGKVKK
jgi:hypothetical protein